MEIIMRRTPKYCRHKARGLAYVRLNGRVIYLGRYGSDQSKTNYNELVGAWHLDRSKPSSARPSLPVGKRDYTIGMMVEAYLDYAEKYYVRDGKSTPECGSIIYAVRPLLRLYGVLPVRDFGPKKLSLVREEFIRKGLCRHQCNQRTSTIRRVFKWAVSEELIDPSISHALAALSGIQFGRTSAPESVPVSPVADEKVEAILPYLSASLADMVKLQRLSGMRPMEVCLLRWCDIDRQQTPWIFRLPKHKTMRFGHSRTVYLGPVARGVLGKYEDHDTDNYLFSPQEVVELQRKATHALRKTPLSCGNAPGTNVVRHPIRSPGGHWITAAYGRAINTACQKAWPLPEHLEPKVITPSQGRNHKPRRETRNEWRSRLTPAEWADVKAWRKAHSWSANQLRHTCGTKVRDAYGLDAAQVVLGHAHAKTTEIYAERNSMRAAEIMEMMG